MGWSEKLVFGYGRSKKEICSLVREQVSEDYEIVKEALVNSVYYGACRNKKTGDVTGLVVQTGWRAGNTYGEWFGYNFISENSGPLSNHCHCPLSVLQHLTPTGNKYALEWREACKANAEADHKNRTKAKRLRELKVGTYIRFANPQETEHFRKGESVLLHKIVSGVGSRGTRTVWTDGSYSWRPGLISADFEVVEAVM